MKPTNDVTIREFDEKFNCSLKTFDALTEKKGQRIDIPPLE